MSILDPLQNLRPKEYVKCFHVSEITSLCDWADQSVILPAATNRESGKWDTSRTPYNRGPIESFLFPYVRQSTMKAATQTGKTIGMFIPILYTIAENPLPVALVYPTGDEDKSVSETRLQPLIRSCPATACLIPSNPDSFKLRRMLFPGMTLFVLSAGTLAEAKQKQICIMIFDEIEAYNLLEGQASDEGDIIGLYEERQKGFWDIRKTLISSSIVRTGGPLDICLAMSEVVFKWHIRCPYCNEWLSLSHDIFYYEDAGEGVLDRIKKARDSAYFFCVSCGNKITDKHKSTLNDTGDWLPGYIEVDPPRRDEEDDPDKYVWRPMPEINFTDYQKQGSYIWKEYLERHKPSLIGWTDIYTSYSPWVSFADIAQQAIIASGNFEKEKVYLKDWWCKVARQKTQAFRSTELLELMDDREEGIVPLEAVALVAGIDNQGNRCYVAVWAVNRMEFKKEEMWLVYYKEIQKTSQVSSEETDYSGVTDFFGLKFKRVGANHAGVPIWRAGMDTGGTRLSGSDDSMSEESYKFIAGNYYKLPAGLIGTKGSSYEMHVGVQKGRVKIDEIHSIYFVNTSYYKHMIARMIKEKRMHLHKNTSQEFMSHLTGEVWTISDKGRWSWKPKANARRVDYLDSTVIALAMTEEIEFQSIKNCSLASSNISYAPKQELTGAVPSGKFDMSGQRGRIAQMQSRLRDRIR